jgi:hypothetical protein
MSKFNFKDYINASGKIHVDKVQGKQASSTLIAGDQRVIMTMLASMIEVMIRNEVFKADDFREIVDIVEKGIKELESK